MRYWDTFEWIAASFMGLMGLFVAWLILVMLPVSLRANANCLEAGYPKATVTWNLKAYCMNMQGAVTVRVDRLSR